MTQPVLSLLSRRLPILTALCGVGIATLAVSNLGTSPTPVTPDRASIDIQANVFTTSAQEQVTVAETPDGGTIAAWASRRQEAGSYGVYARAFDALGRALTDEIRVNVTERGMQHLPAVSVDETGVWFAWESIGQDGSGAGVVARRFDLDLEPRSAEIAVNVETVGDQAAPVIASQPDGRALVTWSTHAGRGGKIRGRRLESDAPIQEAPFEITQEQGGIQGRIQDTIPAVSALSDGTFAVVWARATRTSREDFDSMKLVEAATLSELSREQEPPQRNRFQVVARKVGRAQDDSSDEIVLNDLPGIEPSLAVDGDDRWIVSWLHPSDSGERHDVMVRRFDSNGSPIAGAQIVDAQTDAWRTGVRTAARASGEYSVSYISEQRGAPARLLTRQYSADGTAIGASRAVRVSGGEQALEATVAAASGATRSLWTEAGTLVYAWEGASAADAHAANLTLELAEGVEPPTPITPARTAMAAPDADIEAARPPIWNPDNVRQERRPASENLGGDFGFEAVIDAPWTPPDPEMAVGPEQVLVMTNGAIVAFDKLGNEQWADEIEASFGFWGELGTGGFVFDPEATWDPHAQRFVAMANEQTGGRSYFLLAVSKDNRPDDRDDWHKYRLDVTNFAAPGIDSPNLSLSRDYILLTADFFGPDRYLFLVIDKDSVLEGGTPVLNSEFFSGSHSMGLPVVYSDTGTLYAVQADENGGLNTSITLHGITDPIDNYTRRTFDLSVPSYVTFPADPPQLGSGSRPNLFESRFWSVSERNGALWAVHHVGADRARVRWYEIELNGWPTTQGASPSIAQTGEIDLGAGISTFFPSIHTDADDNVAITFARSASNEYFSIGRVLRAAGDPAGTFRPAQIVQTSQNPHTSGRWGDYSGTQADPQDANTFWGYHEFTDGDNSSWRTWVGRYDLQDEPMLLDFGPIIAGQSATFDVSGATPNAQVFLLFGFDGTGITEIQPLDVAVSIEGPLRFLVTTADANGDATFSVSIPSSGSGREVTLQAAELNRATNWEVETVQ